MPIDDAPRSPRVARSAGRAEITKPNPLARVHKLLDDQETAAREAWNGQPPPQRVYRRWPFRADPVSVMLMTPGGRVTVKMVPRDISCLGIGLLHTAFMHNGTRVVVRLRSRSGADELPGVVVRCVHRGGAMHQIGVTFDEQVDPARYEPSIAERERFAVERVDLSRVRGAALHVEDSMVDRALIAKHLSATQLRVTAVGTAAEARGKISSRWSVVLLDEHLPDGRGTELVAEMRAGGNRTPAVLITADTTERGRELLSACAADAVLFKPLNEAMLHQTLATLLAEPERDGTSVSTLTPDDPAYAMLPEFVASLRSRGEELDQLSQARDTAGCVRVCLAIKGSAGSLGFDPIGVEAAGLMSTLRESGWNAEASSRVRAFVQALRGVGLAEDARLSDAA